MVKLAAPKPNVLDKIKARRQARGIIAYKPGKPGTPVPAPPPKEDLKGKCQGNCNRTACQRPGAIWFNHSTRAYYCVSCAHELNYDRFNKADALRMYGHLLCTEGRYDPEWDYEYNVWKKDIIKFPEEPVISTAGSLTILRPMMEQRFFDSFLEAYQGKRWSDSFGLGRAFYHHFDLYKLKEQSHFRGLSDLDGDEAKDRIREIFEFN